MLCADLADAVKQQFRNPHRKQMLMDLLGSQFKRSYLADEEEAPQILVSIVLYSKLSGRIVILFLKLKSIRLFSLKIKRKS
jgi:hypothetical protein